MSSFLCTANHFNSVELAIQYYIQKDMFMCPYAFKEVFPEFYYKRNASTDKICDSVQNIMNTIRKLSVTCVNLQYQHHLEEGKSVDIKIKKEIQYLLKNRNETVRLNPTALLKALQCLQYQIEIEHLTALRPITKEEENALMFIKEMSNQIAYDVATGTKEYEAAQWCIQ